MKLVWLCIDFVFMWFMTIFASVTLFTPEANCVGTTPEIEIVYRYLLVVMFVFGYILCAFYTFICCYLCSVKACYPMKAGVSDSAEKKQLAIILNRE